MRIRALMVIVASVIELSGVSSLWAEPSSGDVQAGEISIEDTQVDRRDPKERVQDEVKSWVAAMHQYATRGGEGDVPPLREDGMVYLSTFYLYCLNKFGPCPHILEVILESDVREARTKGEAACPTMSRFWKTWLAADLENRAKYLLSIGFGTAVAEFNARERSKYIQCKPTVEAILADSGARKARYGAGGSITSAVAKTTKLLDEVDSKQIDIYRSTGLNK